MSTFLKKTIDIASYIFGNIVFFSLLYAAYFLNMQWATNILIFYISLMAFTFVFIHSNDKELKAYASKYNKAVWHPDEISTFIDTITLLFFIGVSWWYSAVMMFLCLNMKLALIKKIKTMPETDSDEKVLDI